MTKTLVSALILFLAFTSQAMSAAPTVTILRDTDTTVTYHIHDLEGIVEVEIVYDALGTTTVTKSYPGCPLDVVITVQKQVPDPADPNLVINLQQLIVQDCTSQDPEQELDEVRHFDLSDFVDFEFELNSLISQVDPPPPPPTPIGQFVFKWFWVLFLVWAVLTLYLLWWRIFGPFRNP